MNGEGVVTIGVVEKREQLWLDISILAKYSKIEVEDIFTQFTKERVRTWIIAGEAGVEIIMAGNKVLNSGWEREPPLGLT